MWCDGICLVYGCLDASKIVDGELASILDLVWAIILRYFLYPMVFEEPSADEDDISFEVARER